MSQSALIVRVPAAEAHVAHWRERFDPAARLGVPAHITLLFPFMSPELITADVLERISSFAASMQSFAFHLRAIGHFPGVLYLTPEPTAPFVTLTKGLVDLFPEFPPYEGQHDDVIPHLTVAHTDEVELLQVEAAVANSIRTAPIEAACEKIDLIENSTGMWKPMHAFALGAAAHVND